MTAEERAREIVSRRLSDLAQGDWEPVIAEAVRAAEEAEREACAGIAVETERSHAQSYERMKTQGEMDLAARCHARAGVATGIAAAIRRRGTP